VTIGYLLTHASRALGELLMTAVQVAELLSVPKTRV
jgi:hypothetical protein